MSEEGDDGEAELHAALHRQAGQEPDHQRLRIGQVQGDLHVTEATATRRDKTVRAMLNTAQAAQTVGDQELGTVALLTAVMNQDGEGTSDFQKYARKRLVGMGVVEPTDDEKAQMEQAQQNAQPDPMAAVAAAQAQLKAAQAKAACRPDAGIGAATVLKLAQAHALGGPEKRRSAPTGCSRPRPSPRSTATPRRPRTCAPPPPRCRMRSTIEAHRR
jgi:hypothetical protein